MNLDYKAKQEEYQNAKAVLVCSVLAIAGFIVACVITLMQWMS
jgi:hypothetical protein